MLAIALERKEFELINDENELVDFSNPWCADKVEENSTVPIW